MPDKLMSQANGRIACSAHLHILGICWIVKDSGASSGTVLSGGCVQGPCFVVAPWCRHSYREDIVGSLQSLDRTLKPWIGSLHLLEILFHLLLVLSVLPSILEFPVNLDFLTIRIGEHQWV